MKDEQDPPNEQAPVRDDEYVYGRVLMMYVDEDQKMPVAVGGFEPTKHDGTGISVYRAGFVTPEEVDHEGRRHGEYYVVRLCVGDIRAAGMDVVPNPMPPLAGHALIPEIRYGLKGDAKQQFKKLRQRLASLANHPTIILRPMGGAGEEPARRERQGRRRPEQSHSCSQGSQLLRPPAQDALMECLVSQNKIRAAYQLRIPRGDPTSGRWSGGVFCGCRFA
jgi:hypothetical protein